LVAEILAAPEVLGIDEVHQREGDRQDAVALVVVDVLEWQVGDCLLP
jgi:hypothetical protein